MRVIPIRKYYTIKWGITLFKWLIGWWLIHSFKWLGDNNKSSISISSGKHMVGFPIEAYLPSGCVGGRVFRHRAFILLSLSAPVIRVIARRPGEPRARKVVWGSPPAGGSRWRVEGVAGVGGMHFQVGQARRMGGRESRGRACQGYRGMRSA